LPIQVLHNESRLVKEMQAGNEDAFTTLYRHYSPQLYSNILKMIHDPEFTQEIVQELFTRVWQKKENKGITENFAGYLYTIGQHLVHDFFRKLRRDRQLMERFRALVTKHYENIEEELNQKQSFDFLKKAIDQLSPQQRKVYELVKVEGHTYKKTAEIMGISPLTVKEYLVSANKSIREFLLNNMDITLSLILASALI
jgi:RNA polymerase sigma factor (sigma-70 family)